MTIINETTQAIQIGNTWGFGEGVDILTLIICIFTFIFFLVCFIVGQGFKGFRFSGSLLIIFILLTTCLGGLASCHTKPIYEYTPQYEILIDDTVTAREFFDKYDLIDRRGEIFIVAEKTNN